MAVTLDDQEFSLSVVGEVSGEKFFGKFRALRKLGHRLQMTRDRIKREMLGAHPEYASARTLEQAVIFSDLSVSITKAPTWWLESGGGQELVDDSVIREVWKKVIEIQGEPLEEEKKEAAESAKVLKEAVEHPEKEEKEEKDED